MAEDQDESSEKTHEPTPKKREDARKKGDVPRSTDIYTAIAYAGIVLAALLLGGRLMTGIGDVGMVLLRSPGGVNPSGASLADGALQRVFALLVPVLGLPAILVLAAAGAQGQLLMVGSKLKPKLSRISPISNGKQKFGARGMVEFLKSSAKLTAACTVLAVIFTRHAEDILTSMVLAPQVVMLLMFQFGREFMLAILGLTVVIAAADYLWQVADWTKKNRMSYKDLKDENKETEGSPELKQRRRQTAYEIAMSGSIQDVKTADVVVVNPEHYAVALAWNRLVDPAPIVVAKGVDEAAQRIKDMAREHAVPIHSDPPTARALHASVDVGQEINGDQYRAVAAAIRFADALRARRRATTQWTE